MWDRIFDQYVMTPMQAFTADLLRMERDRDPLNVSQAREILLTAYELIDRHLEGRTWVAGAEFSMADCSDRHLRRGLIRRVRRLRRGGDAGLTHPNAPSIISTILEMSE